MSTAKAYLVESIPLGLEELRQTQEVDYTEFALRRLVDNTWESIDLTAVYWNLLPDPSRIDEEGFSVEQFEKLGAEHGRLLYQSMMRAAERGVKFRILQSPGFNEGISHESDFLIQQYPDHTQIRQLDMADWYDSGIMHQKMWVFDRRHVYLGSANMDWKSITQVKELGIVVEDHPEIALDAQKQFSAWWQLARLEPATTRVFDPENQVYRTVPRWSKFVPENDRIKSPLVQQELRTRYNIRNPMTATLNEREGSIFITNSPPEICAPGRTDDLEGILQTIRTAEKSICISVMNYVPLGPYQGKYDEETGKRMLDGEVVTMVWWPAINNALLQAVITKGVYVRLLVSQWAYTHQATIPFLQALQKTADTCQSDQTTRCGKLEIKLFIIPGWDDVTGDGRQYPGHSRVNHTKYIVTDRRLNIGTSNFSWGYFTNSSGTSFNANHRGLVQKLQEIFDRDWESAYAHILKNDLEEIF